jgi:hypothetical protein
MTPQQAQQLRTFTEEIGSLDGDCLLKRLAQFEDSEESREMDLGVAKRLSLEARLVAVFGVMWQLDTKDRLEALRTSRP